jgi:hypothetical protein
MDRFTRILETDDWVVDYDKVDNRYRVAYFVGLNFIDEVWFDGYKDKEASLSEELKNYALVKCNLSEEKLEEIIDKWNSIGCTSFCDNRD